MEFGMAIPEELFDSDADVVAVFLTLGQLQELVEVLGRVDRGSNGFGRRSEDLNAIIQSVCRQATNLADKRSG